MVKPAVMRRLMKEITELKMNPPEGIRVQTAEDNLLNLTGIIEGPGPSAFCDSARVSGRT
jgi:ubiquitin-conjugating enzyme E2 S